MSLLLKAHNGNLESLRREIEASTIEELTDRHKCGASTVWKFCK